MKMRKHIMLGVNGDYCCRLDCLLSFYQLVPTELSEDDFIYSATNCGGCDEIARAEKILKCRRTGRSIRLEKPLEYCGSDCDSGIERPWNFSVLEIHEVEAQNASPKEQALAFLRRELKSAKLALVHAESKPSVSNDEVNNIQKKIDAIDWMLPIVIREDEHE